MSREVVRPFIVALIALLSGLAVTASASAHGGTTIADGGSNGVGILLQGAETTTPGGAAAVDLSTILQGPGTGDGATVTYWIRPSGGKTFRAATTRDDAGVAHTEVPTADRGSWRDWDISAVVKLTDGKRLRVSNAEANPPGPEPAATAGGGAAGPDEGSPEAGGTTTTAPPATTETAPPAVTTTEGSSAPTDTTTESAPPADPTTVDEDTQVDDVTGEKDGAPGWVVPSVVVVVVLLVGWAIIVRRRRSTPDDNAGDEQDSRPN